LHLPDFDAGLAADLAAAISAPPFNMICRRTIEDLDDASLLIN